MANGVEVGTVGNHMKLIPQKARGAQGAEMVGIIGLTTRAVKMHVGGDPVHTRLCTEPEEGEYIGGADSKVRRGFEDRPVDG